MENNSLQNIPDSYNGSLSLNLITNRNLMHYPEFKDTDVIKSENLANEEKQVILASLNYPKIRNLNISIGDGNIYYDELTKIIGKAVWDMGITEKSMNETELDLFYPVAIEEIVTDFAHLTIEDVRIAFKRGSRRKYGDFFQMTTAAISCWLTAYTEETKPNAMLKLPYIKKIEIRTIIEIVRQEQIIVSDEELKRKHELWIGGIYQRFEDFKVSGNYDFVDFGNKFYNYCKKLGLIKLDEKQQQDLWDRAVKLLKDEYHPKNGRTFGQRIDMKNVYESLKNADEIDKKTEEIIIIRAKKLTVMYFFKKLISQKKELKDVIEHQEKLLKEKVNGTGKKITSHKKD